MTRAAWGGLLVLVVGGGLAVWLLGPMQAVVSAVVLVSAAGALARLRGRHH